MNITTREVSRDYLRNGKLNIKGGVNSSYSGSSSYGTITGNYLPAKINSDGTYTVDLSKVHFTGNIVAEGEVSAYGAGESGGTTGSVTIYDGLDSTATDVALSANQGRILKELITSTDSGEGDSISTLTDVTLTNLEDGQILKYDATLGYWVNEDGTKVTWQNIEGKPEGLTDENIQKIVDFKADDYLLKSVWDSVFTIDDSGNLRVKSNLIGEKEISAYGDGINSGSGSGVTIYDGLDSTSKDVALSANQGRVLKNLIDNIDFPDIDLSDYYTKTQVDNLLDTINLSGYYNKTEIDNLLAGYTSITSFNDHTGDTTKHITATERTNWNKAYTNNHTHSNKAALDGITSTKVSNWDTVYSNWDKVFTIDSNGDLKVKVNVIGEKEISAYGAGTSSGSGGSITIVDSLLSTATDAALSANQGRILKELIENIGDVDLSNYYNKSEVDKLIGDIQAGDVDLASYYNKTEINQLLQSYATVTNLNNLSTSLTNHIGDTTKHITATERTNWNTAFTNNHTHSNKSVLDGITSTLVGNWNKAYTNNHTHSNKSILDDITSAKVSNWDSAYSKITDYFYIDDNGNLHTEYNFVSDGEVSAYGEGSGSGGSGSVVVIDNLTSTSTEAALSANMGRYLKSLIDNIDVGDLSGYYSSSEIDNILAGYSRTSHTHSYVNKINIGTKSYSVSSNTISLPAYPTLTSLGAASSNHSHTFASLTSKPTTLSGYGITDAAKSSHTHNYASTVKVGSTSYSVSSNTITLPAYPTLSSLGAASSNHSHTFASLTTKPTTLSGYGITDGSPKWAYNYSNGYLVKTNITAGSSAMVTFRIEGNSYGGSDRGILTVGNFYDYTDGTAMYNPGATHYGYDIGDIKVFRYDGYIYMWIKKATSYMTLFVTVYTSTGGNRVTSISDSAMPTSGYTRLATITPNQVSLSTHTHNYAGSESAGGAANSAIKLANSRTLWGQSFNGTANVSGNITGSYFKINDTSSNPYLQLTQGSTWYIQGYNSYLYLGAGSTKSLRIDSSGNCLSVGEVTAHSDKRLKSDIKPLEVRGELNPVTYVKDGKESIGFIADEVKEVYPELVVTDESTDEKYLSLNYAQLTAVLYAEIKELKNQIRELNEKVRTMAN